MTTHPRTPDIHMGGQVVSCYVCDGEIELPAECCEKCGTAIDEDSIRDQLEAQNEPDEDWGTDR